MKISRTVLVAEIIYYSKSRDTCSLDRIFNEMANHVCSARDTSKLLEIVYENLKKDTESLAWLIGYLVGEINTPQDNDNPNKPVTEFARTLLAAGLVPGIDFIPCPLGRIIAYPKVYTQLSKSSAFQNGRTDFIGVDKIEVIKNLEVIIQEFS